MVERTGLHGGGGNVTLGFFIDLKKAQWTIPEFLPWLTIPNMTGASLYYAYSIRLNIKQTAKSSNGQQYPSPAFVFVVYG